MILNISPIPFWPRISFDGQTPDYHPTPSEKNFWKLCEDSFYDVGSHQFSVINFIDEETGTWKIRLDAQEVSQDKRLYKVAILVGTVFTCVLSGIGACVTMEFMPILAFGLIAGSCALILALKIKQKRALAQNPVINELFYRARIHERNVMRVLDAALTRGIERQKRACAFFILKGLSSKDAAAATFKEKLESQMTQFSTDRQAELKNIFKTIENSLQPDTSGFWIEDNGVKGILRITNLNFLRQTSGQFQKDMLEAYKLFSIDKIEVYGSQNMRQNGNEIVRFFKDHLEGKNLRSLTLVAAGLDDNDLKLLGEWLKGNQVLECLTLNGTFGRILNDPFGESGFSILLKGLEDNKTLRKLDFSGCENLNDNALSNLKAFLEEHSSVKHLNIRRSDTNLDFVELMRESFSRRGVSIEYDRVKIKGMTREFWESLSQAQQNS